MKQDDVFLPLEMSKVFEARKSCRTFKNKDISEKALLSIRAYISAPASPFGGDVRLKLVDINANDPDMTSSKCTKRVITGARRFLCAEVPENVDYALIQVGYAMERAVLFMTAMGLSCCYLGGTYDKNFFRSAVAPKPRSIVPLVAAFGYASEKKSFIDKVMALLVKNKKRDFGQLFFEGDFDNELSPSGAGRYKDFFEAVRLAPSSRNSQPCRIVLDGNKAHFYKDCSKPVHGEFDMNEIDMGIAMSHFALSAAGAGFQGEFYTANVRPDGGEFLDYVASYEIKEKERAINDNLFQFA